MIIMRFVVLLFAIGVSGGRMKIRIKTIPHKKHRYQTLGDYWETPKGEEYRISELGNEFYEKLIAIHELIEWTLCKRDGVTEEEITQWDLNHLTSDDPGSIHGCPYHKQHMFATAVEYGMLKVAGLKREDYEKFLEKFLETAPTPTTKIPKIPCKLKRKK